MRRLIILALLLLVGTTAHSTIVGPPGSGGAGDGVGISGVRSNADATENGPTITFSDSATVTWDCTSTSDTCVATSTATGDVAGPVSSTDSAIPTWSGTGGDTLQDSACDIASGDLTCTGSMTGTQFIGSDVDGENYLELYDNPSTDVDAPTGDRVRLFTKDDQSVWVKRSGDGAGEALELGARGDWLYARLGASAGSSESIATDDAGPYPWYSPTYTTSASGLIDYAPLLFCTDGANVGQDCTVSGSGAVTDCGSGAVSGCEEWGGYEINKVGKFEIGMNIGYTIDPTLGRYATCTGGGTNDGQRCVAAADCFGGGTCTGTTGAVGTIACVAMEQYTYPGQVAITSLAQTPPTMAPTGQYITGANAQLSRAQFPKQVGRWVVEVTSPPFQFYPRPFKCHSATQTNMPAHTILTGSSSLWISELP